MNTQEIELAQQIFAKDEWTNDDHIKLQKLFDKGHREELKRLRERG